MTATTHNYNLFKTWYEKLKQSNSKAFFILATDQAGKVRFICYDQATAGDCLPMIKEAYINIQNSLKRKETTK